MIDAPATKRQPPRHVKGSGEHGERVHLTERQRRFVHEYLSGAKTATEAAIRAGYSPKSARGQVYDLMRLPAVRAEIDKVADKAREQTAYTVAQAFDEAGRALEFAYKTKNANAAVRALEHRARLHGLLIDKAQVDVALTANIDLAGALTEAKARVLRPIRDPEPAIAAEFTALPKLCHAGPRDCESVAIDRPTNAPDMSA